MNWKVFGAAAAAVVHALGSGLAMHALGMNAHGWAILCIGYGGAVYYVVRRAFP